MCSKTHTTLFAISHTYNDPTNTVLYRVTIPAWTTGTNWGDGNNGFFYQVSLALNGTPVASPTPHNYVPFNGVGVTSSGQPQLLPFSFIYPATMSTSGTWSLSITACSSNYAAEGATTSTPACTKSYWTDTYSPLITPSTAGPPFFGVATLKISPGNVTVPNTGVYPMASTLEPPSTLSASEVQWLYDHQVFYDVDGNVYTNDLDDVNPPDRRSVGYLPVETAGYADPSSNPTQYLTKYGTQVGISSAAFPDQEYFFYSGDTFMPGQSFSVIPGYSYDLPNPSDTATSCTVLEPEGGTRCGMPTPGSGLNATGALAVLPSGGLGNGVTISAQDGAAGTQEIRSYTVSETGGSATCTSMLNPLAINLSAYNQPNYVLNQLSGTWSVSFPTALYYITPSGFGPCVTNSVSNAPFCERTMNYVGYVPQYADAGGPGTLNGGSTTGSRIVSFQLADEYEVTGASSDTNSLVWFDNCGYGYTYSETAVSGRKSLPQPPNSGTTYNHTIENDLGFAVVFGKECCASYYQQNTDVNPLAYEPPQEIDNSNGILIPAGQSVLYKTIFNDEAMVVYNAGSGSKLFKLRLHPTGSSSVYSCASSGQHAGVSGSAADFTVSLGSGSLTCANIGLCPFPMSASTNGPEVTCTTTQSSFILGLPDWISEVTAENDTVRLVGWGGSGKSAPESACNTAGGGSGSGGFALTVQQLSQFPDKLYAYVGVGGSSTGEGGSSTVLALSPPLSTIETPQTITDPTGVALLVAGGGGAGGETNCIYVSGDAFSYGGGAGGAGGVAIANTSPGAAVSVSGSTGGESSPGKDGKSGGEGGNLPPDYEGAGASGATSGLGGFGNVGNVKWDHSGSLIPPPDTCSSPPPTPTPQTQGQWCGGNGAASSLPAGGGGGGFGGGARGSEDDNDAGSGGGGGGSWAAKNTAVDPTAPTEDGVPGSPGGSNGAVQFVYYTGPTPTPTFAACAKSGSSVTCTLASGQHVASLEGVLVAANAAAGGSTLTDTSPMWIRAWGGSGGAGDHGALAGGHGVAQTLTSIAALQSMFGASATQLYYYIGQGGQSDTSGMGGASTLVSTAELSTTAACINEGCSQNIVVLAGGGGGGGSASGGTNGSYGGLAIATAGNSASGAGGSSDSAGGGSGGTAGASSTEGSGGGGAQNGVGGFGGPVQGGGPSGSYWVNETPATVGSNGRGAEGLHDSSSGHEGGGGGGGWGGGGGGGAGGSVGHGGGGGGSYAIASTQNLVVPGQTLSAGNGTVQIGFLLSNATIGSSVYKSNLVSTSQTTPTSCLSTDQSGAILQTSNRTLSWQGDGNLVLYDTTVNPNQSVWASNTNGKGTALCFQGDGNLVVYEGSSAIFSTGTADSEHDSDGGSLLILQSDCNLCIYDANGVSLFCTQASLC